jgi:hypothetical protein
MAERAEREPTMEEIVVALRATRRDADRVQPLALARQGRNSRSSRGVASPTDLADLRDGEIDRLLAENTRLNARVVSLLKAIEQDQAFHAEAAAEAAAEPARTDTDREAIGATVRAALEAELNPVLLVLLRMLERQRIGSVRADQDARLRVALSATPEGAPSDWIVDLMRKLDRKAPAQDEPVPAASTMLRRPKLRQRVAEVINAFRSEPYAVAARRRFPPYEEPR